MATEKDTALLVAELSANYNRLKKDLDKANGVAVKGRSQLEKGFLGTNRNIAKSSDEMSRSVAKSYERAASSALRSSSGLKSALLASAATIGAAFGAVQVEALADGYTRFTNQLKTAGLEGGNLADVQDRLFGTAQKYGVELEALGTLYGRNSAAAKELNLGTAQQLQLTNAVAAALKIQGGTTEEASGSLLQLSQALGGSKIQAQEYNSLIDGLRPLLQGIAEASDKYKGSVAALTKDVKAGNVTNKEFADLILKASSGLEQRATKSNFTIAASFQIVNNALGKYIGETDASLSATQRISQGLIVFSENLDKIIPALVVIVGLIGVRYAAAGVTFVATETARTAALVRSTLATEAATAANLQLTAAGLRGTLTASSQAAAITSQAVAMGVATTAARGLGASLLAAFGGPVGLAIIAITASIAGLVAIEQRATQATAEYANMAKGGEGALRAYEDAALAAAIATGKQAQSARDAAAAARVEAVQVRDGAKAKLQSAQASLALLRAEAARVKDTISPYMGEGSAPTSAGELRLNDLRQKQQLANVNAAQVALDAAIRSINNADQILTAKAPALSGDGTKAKAVSAKDQARIDATREGRFSTSTRGKEAVLADLAQVQSIAVKTVDDVHDLWAEGISDLVGEGVEQEAALYTAHAARLAKQQQEEYAATYNGIRGALEAIKNDGFAGFAEYLGDALEKSVLDALASALTNAATNVAGSLLSRTAMSLFGVPSFAKGTSYAPGGMAYVHKNETIQLPKGSRVNTVAQTAAMMSRPSSPARSVIINQMAFPMSFDGAVVTSDLIAEARANAYQIAAQQQAQTLKIVRASAPGRQLSYAQLGT